LHLPIIPVVIPSQIHKNTARSTPVAQFKKEMNLGIPIAPEALNAYTKLKMENSLRYVVFKLRTPSLNLVEVDFDAPTTADMTTLLEALPVNEPRYICYKYPLAVEGTIREKMLLLLYVPDGCPIRMRTVYPGNKGPFKSALTGIQNDIDVDRSGLTVAYIEDKLRR